MKGVQVDTAPKEMELIYHLASNPNRVFTRDQLLDEVWGLRLLRRQPHRGRPCEAPAGKAGGRLGQVGPEDRVGVGYKFEVKE